MGITESARAKWEQASEQCREYQSEVRRSRERRRLIARLGELTYLERMGEPGLEGESAELVAQINEVTPVDERPVDVDLTAFDTGTAPDGDDHISADAR